MKKEPDEAMLDQLMTVDQNRQAAYHPGWIPGRRASPT